MKRKEMYYLLIFIGIFTVFLLGVGIGKKTAVPVSTEQKESTESVVPVPTEQKESTESVIPVPTEQKESTESVIPVPTEIPNALNIEVSAKIKADYGYCMEYLREKYPGHAFDIVNCQDTQNVTIFTMRADDDGETQFTVCIMHCEDTVTAADTFALKS